MLSTSYREVPNLRTLFSKSVLKFDKHKRYKTNLPDVKYGVLNIGICRYLTSGDLEEIINSKEFKICLVALVLTNLDR